MPLTASLSEHTIYPSLLAEQSVVVDCGANEGAFSMAMIRQFGCTCYAFEASPVVFPRIPDHPRLTKVNVALCGADRSVDLNVCESSQSTSLNRLPGHTYLETVPVPGRRLEPLLGSLGVGRVDLLKVDIEGAEIELFDSCSDEFLRAIGQITIEFHEFLPAVPVAEVERVLGRLRRLGFRDLRGTRLIDYRDVLLVNAARVPYVEYLWARSRLRLRRGVFRLGQILGLVGRGGS